MAKSEETTGAPPPGYNPTTTGGERQYRMCVRCGCAENPRSQLAFADTPEGAMCANCYERHYGAVAAPRQAPVGIPAPIPGGGMVLPETGMLVIPCPDCGGRPAGPHGKPCKTCLGFLSVRVAENALPVYIPPQPKKRPEILTEEEADEGGGLPIIS